jgi:hypothetical protein
MWHDFVRSAPEDDTVWDMALLDPLMVRMTPKHATQMIKIHMPAAEISAETVRHRQTGSLRPSLKP